MRKNEQSLGEAFKQLYKKLGIEDKATQFEVENAWKEMIGDEIYQKTQFVKVKNNEIEIKINSALIRQEFQLHQTELLQKINEKLRKNYTKIQFA